MDQNENEDAVGGHLWVLSSGNPAIVQQRVNRMLQLQFLPGQAGVVWDEPEEKDAG